MLFLFSSPRSASTTVFLWVAYSLLLLQQHIASCLGYISFPSSHRTTTNSPPNDIQLHLHPHQTTADRFHQQQRGRQQRQQQQQHRRHKMTSNDHEPSTTVPSPPAHVVIAGSGMMGVATAYYLAKDFGISSTLVDPSGIIAPAASGKAGGFLALDWNDGSPIGPLTRRSFQLHQELADELGAERLQYRRLSCMSIAAGSGGGGKPRGKKLEGVEWAEGAVSGVRTLGTEDTIAQVHPKMLCMALWEETQSLLGEEKCRLIQGKVTGTIVDNNKNADQGGPAALVQLEDGSVVNGDAILYACGPWTTSTMSGIKYHSVVIPTPDVLSQCVFFSGHGDPEVYVRPDQTAYCTGFPDAPTKVTEEPGQEVVRPEAVAQITSAVQTASQLGSEESDKAMISNACYLPCTPDGIPFMGQISEGPNAFVATGHTCWGILMGPGTGESMAHLIATGKSTPHVELSRFDPNRFGPLTMVPPISS